jgi:hypothetical protein
VKVLLISAAFSSTPVPSHDTGALVRGTHSIVFAAHALLVYRPSEHPCCYGNTLQQKPDEATHFFLFEELEGFLDMAKHNVCFFCFFSSDVDLLRETRKLGPPDTILDSFLFLPLRPQSTRGSDIRRLRNSCGPSSADASKYGTSIPSLTEMFRDEYLYFRSIARSMRLVDL